MEQWPGGELPPLVDTAKPNAARIYDYLLGGSHHFAVDRETAEQVIAAGQVSALPAIANRAFLGRAVRFMVEQGIDQFLDLGSGIPTVGNVHEVARRLRPDARVVYVDNEPVAVAHARQLLEHDRNTAMIAADLRDSTAILGHPEVARLLDFDRPVGLLLVSVLHFIDDEDDPAGIVAGYRSVLAPGSIVALSHYTTDGYDAAKRALADKGLAAYRRTAIPVHARGRAELAELVSGLDLVPPGVVWTPQWRPAEHEPTLCEPAESEMYAVLARVLD